MPVSSLLAAAGDLVDLVLPRYCLGCRAPGAALCARCAAPQVQLVDVARLRVTAGAVYDGAVRTALLAYKERDRRDLVPALRRLLTAALAAQTCSPGVLVPVPSSAVARRARGGDHVLRLLPRRMPRRQVLRLIRTVRDSAGLDAHARALNLAGAFAAASPPWPGAPAVIVDDIVTSGATLREAAAALQEAGWTVAGAAVVAATPRRFPARADAAPVGSGIHPPAIPGTSRQAGLPWQ